VLNIKYKNECWGIIPARGGSKTIPLKNMVSLNGKPLIDYVIKVAKNCEQLDRIICSTENEKIASFCLANGIEVHRRPKELSGDQVHVVDVLVNLLKDYALNNNQLPDFIVLLQPTSPFVLPEHIQKCISNLKKDKRAKSAQTITTFPHNFHAYNQRVIEEGYVTFKFVEEKKAFWTKQQKPKLYAFGNVVVTMTETLIKEKEIFANPSIPHIIPFPYALDVDGPDELIWAEIMIKSQMVKLP